MDQNSVLYKTIVCIKKNKDKVHLHCLDLVSDMLRLFCVTEIASDLFY